jgi:hypothetical protein
MHQPEINLKLKVWNFSPAVGGLLELIQHIKIWSIAFSMPHFQFLTYISG